jgi:hypothetical protein
LVVFAKTLMSALQTTGDAALLPHAITQMADLFASATLGTKAMDSLALMLTSVRLERTIVPSTPSAPTLLAASRAPVSPGSRVMASLASMSMNALFPAHAANMLPAKIMLVATLAHATQDSPEMALRALILTNVSRERMTALFMLPAPTLLAATLARAMLVTLEMATTAMISTSARPQCTLVIPTPLASTATAPSAANATQDSLATALFALTMMSVRDPMNALLMLPALTMMEATHALAILDMLAMAQLALTSMNVWQEQMHVLP